jgi:hypothetical protein
LIIKEFLPYVVVYPLAYPLATLADVRTLLRHLPPEHR